MPEQLEIERKFLLKKLPQNVEILALKFTNVIRYYSNKHEKVSQESGKHLLIRKSEIDGQRIRKEIIHEINPRDFKNFVENQATEKLKK